MNPYGQTILIIYYNSGVVGRGFKSYHLGCSIDFFKKQLKEILSGGVVLGIGYRELNYSIKKTCKYQSTSRRYICGEVSRNY